MSVATRGGAEVVNFGCRLNIAEGEAIRAAVREAAAPDTIVFNSCAVTDEAVRQARQAVRRALRESPGRRVVVTAPNVTSFVTSRSVPNVDGSGTSAHCPSPPPDVSQYCRCQPCGTAMPEPPVVLSYQKSIDVRSTRTGSSNVYWSQRVAGSFPVHVPHRSTWLPPEKNGALPSFTASTLFQPVT